MVSAQSRADVAAGTAQPDIRGGSCRSAREGIPIVAGAMAQITGSSHARAGPVHLMLAARRKDRALGRGAAGKSAVAPGTITGSGDGIAVARISVAVLNGEG